MLIFIPRYSFDYCMSNRLVSASQRRRRVPHRMSHRPMKTGSTTARSRPTDGKTTINLICTGYATHTHARTHTIEGTNSVLLHEMLQTSY